MSRENFAWFMAFYALLCWHVERRKLLNQIKKLEQRE